jgi:hypothetical protein
VDTHFFEADGKGTERPRALKALMRGASEYESIVESGLVVHAEVLITPQLADSYHHLARPAEPRMRSGGQWLNRVSPFSHIQPFDAFKRHISEATSIFKGRPRADGHD